MSFLIDIDVCKTLREAMNDPVYDISKEVIMCLLSLSIAKDEDLSKIYEDGIVSMITPFIT